MEHGYEGTTTARIRETSGVSNGTLFHHFPTKDAIAAALYVDAVRSLQEGHWKMLSEQPTSFRAAVDAIIHHQLEWIQTHRDQARFLYARGHVSWNPSETTELVDLNRKLMVAYRGWLRPFIESGEMRPLSTQMITAITVGPTHSIAQSWLSTPGDQPLTRYADELAVAAWAALAGKPHDAATTQTPPAAPTRLRIQLVGADGETLGDAEVSISPSDG